MYKRWMVTVFLTVGASLGLAACGGNSEGGGGNATGPLKVGVLISETGPLANLGVSVKAGVGLAEDAINAAGGVDGRKLEIVYADDKGAANVAAAEIHKLISEDVAAIVGPGTSDAQLAVSPLETKERVPSIPVTGSPAITRDVAPYAYSIFASAASLSKAMTDYAKNHHATSAAIFTDSTSIGLAAADAIKAEAAANGIRITDAISFPRASSDLTSQILRLKSGDPDVLLFFPTAQSDAGTAAKNINESGWSVPVISNYAASITAPGVEIAGSAYDDILAVQYRGFTYCPGQPTHGPTSEFLSHFKASSYAGNDEVSPSYASLWYDAVNVLAEAIASNDEKTDGPTIANWIGNNADQLKAVNAPFSKPSGGYNELIGADALAIVHPTKVNPDGLQLRADCTDN